MPLETQLPFQRGQEVVCPQAKYECLWPRSRGQVVSNFMFKNGNDFMKFSSNKIKKLLNQDTLKIYTGGNIR